MRTTSTFLAATLVVGLAGAAHADDTAAVPPPPPVERAPDEPAPAPAPAERDAGLLFNLNNVFTSGGVLGGWQGFGLGLQKRLANGMTARLGVELARATNPVDVVKTTLTNGSDVVVSYELNVPTFTSQHAAAAVFDVVKPLTDGKMAPYAGAGLSLGYLQQDLTYTDDVTVVDQVVDVDDSSKTLGVGVRGILGVAWRYNPRFSLFAEYQLGVNLISWTSVHSSTTTENTASGTPATMRLEQEFRETRWLNFDLGLAQGAALGLVAHF